MTNLRDKILINPERYMDFAKNSTQIIMPGSNEGKRELLSLFKDSCVYVILKGQQHKVGILNWANGDGYSITVDGERLQFSYSQTESIFKPKLC